MRRDGAGVKGARLTKGADRMFAWEKVTLIGGIIVVVAAVVALVVISL